MVKIITWVDLQGRYRVTSPAYDDLAVLRGFTEDDAINWVWTNIVASGIYGIDFDHPLFLVEDAHQRRRLIRCCGGYFRYAGEPDSKGRRDARGGAWEMDIDGRPKVNMAKARDVQRGYIRQARDIALTTLDVPYMRALEAGDVSEQRRIGAQKQVLRDIPQTFDLSTATTPEALKAAWPPGLPERIAA